MAKYRCKICGHIYDEEKERIKFDELPDNWVCPMCGVPKNLFEKIEEDMEVDMTPKNAVKISKDNVSIERDLSKCVNCGLCKQTCQIREGMTFDKNSTLCVNCGQCIQTCPTKSLNPKNDIKVLEESLKTKICIAYTSPAIRVAIGDYFNKEYGSFEQKKLVGILKEIGFQYVFDTTFAADLTTLEEASELVNRIQNNGKLPMITSCCPAWVKYAEQFYPEILDHISTCKSPIGMMGPVVKEFWTKKNNVKKNEIFTVAITPCTAKKYEIKRPEITGTDLVITTRELFDIIKSKNIDYNEIKDLNYDSFNGSNSGLIFGNTGGVMEAALRTSNYLITGTDLEDTITFNEVRGFDNVKEATIQIGDYHLNVAVIHQMSSAKPILDEIKKGNSKYHFIEIMNCIGGCIGGGGQPMLDMNNESEIKKKRLYSLYDYAEKKQIRYSHHNPELIQLYNQFLNEPLSDISKKYLHTSYQNKGDSC